ncbi:MAG TPA: NAD(P)-binding domain-containing protein [Candidatus Baltobacteraceae bacterium]|nr:NAD(P)-binding domain-containing protein [Candidatus Baltobacteraceae bacterium]
MKRILEMASPQTIGFIGLGAMGEPMARSLLRASASYIPPPGFGSPTLPSVDQILIGDFATYLPSTFQGGSKLIVTPRDEGGTILGLTASRFSPACSNTHGGAGIDIPVCQPRTDGYYFGATLIQGVRAYDPGSSQWTTPDAYAGDITDPMSQQKYMWNGNNPISYSDPSGYRAVGPKLKVIVRVHSIIPTNPPVIRRPDYFSLRLNVAIPNPWTATLFGPSGELDVDRYGHIYGGLGFGFGKSLTFFSGSLTAGWLQRAGPHPSPTAVSAFIRKWTINGTVGGWIVSVV